ncbi:MAG: ABC transporter ATP-binding protein [Gemmatimonadetes bacterium]|jgi:peptide/nickel transport system ATP-binding protein|nr:ABC transporter ATP-binding protein [Gemmatimonadota bacterium]MBT7858973.1 ABC transporter ATP-binding protein [Gemmatimonadota bacterium]
MNDTSARPLIRIRDLHVEFALREGVVHAIEGVDLDIPPNRTIGLVGESGCGKSVTSKAILRILPNRASITRGAIELDQGDSTLDLVPLPVNSRTMREIRGGDIAMIFQEPMASLSPVHTIGNQIEETIRLHQKDLEKSARRAHVVEMLNLVGMPMAERRFDAYPHELSGGLRQRAMIAMALSCQPRLLIADEPTTALDVTIQAQILNLIERLQKELGMAVMMITHDLGVIAETADEVAVMYLGRIVEQATVGEIFDNTQHPYTKGLIESIPHMGSGSGKRLSQIPGSVPDPFSTPAGCPFHPRCPESIAGTCDADAPPPLIQIADDHKVACHLYTT